MLLISADLDELIGLSDTIEVILRGGWSATFDPHDRHPEDLGSAMTGGEGDGMNAAAVARKVGLALLAPLLAVVVAVDRDQPRRWSSPVTSVGDFWSVMTHRAEPAQHRQHPQPDAR